MNVYFLRHGQTAKNKENVLQGRSNSPLNKKGVSQVEAVKAFFEREGISFDRVYTSPLQRCLQTARVIVGDEQELIEDERLLEMDYGPYEGSSLKDPAPEVLAFFRDFAHTPAPEGMESLASIVGRMGDFMEFLKVDAAGAKNVLVSTHAIAMKGALEYLTPTSKGAYWYTNFGNCIVYYTRLEGDGFLVPVEFWAGER